MDKAREKLKEYWINRLNKALQENEETFNTEKDLMTDELDFGECEEVFDKIE